MKRFVSFLLITALVLAAFTGCKSRKFEGSDFILDNIVLESKGKDNGSFFTISDKFPELKEAVNNTKPQYAVKSENCLISRFDAKVLSYTYTGYMGDWHNFTIDGTEIQITDLVPEEKYADFKTVCGNFIMDMTASSYSLMIPDAADKVSHFENLSWHFDVASLVFEVDLDGMTNFSVYVPYENLSDSLKPEFMPDKDAPIYGSTYCETIYFGENSLTSSYRQLFASPDDIGHIWLNGSKTPFYETALSEGFIAEGEIKVMNRFCQISAYEAYLEICVSNVEKIENMVGCTLIYDISSDEVVLLDVIEGLSLSDTPADLISAVALSEDD